MNGKHTLIIKNKHCTYKITINRNITVITGDSGIGKTSIWNMIRDYVETNGKTQIKFIADCNVVPFHGTLDDFIDKHNKINNSIFLLDENCKFILSNDFADIVKHSTNYFVLISRIPLVNLPYSVKSVLTLVTTKNGEFLETHTEDLFSDISNKEKCEVIFTEDSNSGRDFWKQVSKVDVADSKEEPNGKSALYGKLLNAVSKGSNCLVVADGAAFGSEFLQILKLTKAYNKQIVLWLPESFEWLLLKSGVVWKYGVDEILMHPENYINSEEFLSWERFFTWVTVNIMANTNYPYNKSSLLNWYASPVNTAKIKNITPEIVRDMIFED